MAAGMPEIGSKISLISKADIRYEGRLFTVDPTECTIALSNVRSFGTEDREAQVPIPAQGQMYEYILFRGSDIKDIRVLNNVAHNPPLNDPAIMQLSVPPSAMNQHAYQSHPMMGGYGAYNMGGMASGLAPGMGMPRDPRNLPGSKPTSILELIAGGSRSTTPASLGSRKSPTNDQSVQTGGTGRHNQDNRNRSNQGGNQQQNQQQRYNNQRQNSQSRERRDSRGDGQDHQNRNQNRDQNNRQQMNRSQGYNQGFHQGYNQGYQQGGYGNNQQQRGAWGPRGPMRPRGRPRGGFRMGPGGPQQQPQNNQGNNKKPLKFEKDYDFEEANTQFENLRTQLAKVKLEDGSSTSTNKSEVTTNGDVDKKDDSGNETGAGEPEQEEDGEIFYDKKKSFFDKISCEAVERAKGKSQRTDWRVERKLNSETFGVAATRRGNFRGRGGFRGGMGFRGGYRGGYQRPPQRRDQPNQPQPQPPQEEQGKGLPSTEQTEQNLEKNPETTPQISPSDERCVPVPVTAGAK